MTPAPPTAFDFGENWARFSTKALTPKRVAQARREFSGLLEGIPLAGRTFLDIGFGQGLSLLAAAALGARATGCDINPKCTAVLRSNLPHFTELEGPPHVVVGSILDSSTLAALRRQAEPAGTYDLVHSWGVLHHTGDMQKAIRHAASLVTPGGHLILAIYNRHWSSKVWTGIKWTYVKSPRWLQRLIVIVFYPIIYGAKWLVTGKSPNRQERGMDFYYNVVDWVGGYPYEYASRAETECCLAGLGFKTVRSRAAIVPTGCNEFVFQRAL